MEKLKLVYSIKKEEWLEGYDLYQKIFRQKFTYIKAAVFLIPLLLFIQQIWLDPYFKMGYVCIAVCIGAIVCIFLTPRMERKTHERALEAIKDDKYKLTVTEEAITVETILPDTDREYLEKDKDGNEIPLPEIRPTVIPLSERSLKLIESENVVGIFTKTVSIVIPRSELNDYDVETLKKAIKN